MATHEQAGRRTLREAQKSSTLELLTDAAREVFQKQGYAATVDDICRRAAVSRGTFYLHFSTKGRALAHLYSRDYVAALPHWLAGLPRCSDLEPTIKWVSDYVDLFRANKPVIDAWFEAGVREAGLLEESQDVLDIFFDRLGEAVREMREEHGIPTAPEEARVRGLMAYTLTNRATYFLVRDGIKRDNARPTLPIHILAETWQTAFGRVPDSLTRGA